MIAKIPFENPSIVGILIDGKIEKPDIVQIRERCQKAIADHGGVRIYVELKEWDGISFGALIEDLKLGLSHFKHFKKKAVVSKEGFASKIAAFTSHFPISMQVKHFLPEEVEEAEAWINS